MGGWEEFIVQLLTYEILLSPPVRKPGHMKYHRSCYKIKIPGYSLQRFYSMRTGEKLNWNDL